MIPFSKIAGKLEALLSSLVASALANAAATDLPNWAGYPGHVVAQQQWTDNSGRNVVYIKETGDIRSKHPDAVDEDLRDAELHAYQLRWSGGGWQQVWHVQDFVRNCPLDLGVDYIKPSLQTVDLDANGVREVSFVYTVMDCVGDAGPKGIKLILQDSQRKYAVRGSTTVYWRDEKGRYKKYGGDMKMDAAFDQAAPGFKRHALVAWKQYQKQLEFKQ